MTRHLRLFTLLISSTSIFVSNMSISTVAQGKRKATSNAETKDRALATRNRVIEVLAGTANGCLSELGYFPGMPQRMAEMEQQNRQWQTENVKLFEDNRRLVEVIRSQNERLDWSRLPDANRIAKIIELQEENRFLKSQRDELLKLAAMPGGAQTRQPSYEQLYAEYCKLAEAHRGVLSEVNRLKQKNSAQSQQNAGAGQLSLSKPNSRTQTPRIPSNTPSMHQTHSQMQPPSHNILTSTSAQGTNVKAYQQHPMQLTQTQRAFYQQKPQKTPGSSISPASQVSGKETAPAQAQQNLISATLSTMPHSQNQHLVNFQEAMPAVSPRSSEMEIAGASNRLAQPKSWPPENSRTVYSPIDVYGIPSTELQPSLQTSIVGPTLSEQLPTPTSGAVGYTETPTISTVALQDTILQHQGPDLRHVSTTQSPINVLQPSESTAPTDLHSGSEGVSPVGLKRSVDEVSHDVLDHIEGFLKKPRLEIIEDETGNDLVSTTMEEAVESDDDEIIEVGPDGLRVVSDCLESLLIQNGENDAVRTCRLCDARFRMGYVTVAREPFVNATEDELVLHFTSEHAEAWHALRTEV